MFEETFRETLRYLLTMFKNQTIEQYHHSKQGFLNGNYSQIYIEVKTQQCVLLTPSFFCFHYSVRDEEIVLHFFEPVKASTNSRKI